MDMYMDMDMYMSRVHGISLVLVLASLGSWALIYEGSSGQRSLNRSRTSTLVLA